MEFEKAKSCLKKELLTEVSLFCRRDKRRWKGAIVKTLRELAEIGAQSVFFGGTLRSLLVSRHVHNKPGRPRDIDIVVSGVSLEVLRQHFEGSISRETRFGGLQLQRSGWQFDLWPLQQTWAFVRDDVTNPEFKSLPSTTFFNLEAIAVEVWPRPGRTRKIFAHDDQFFEGIISKTLEMNREDNPYPELCVLRALVLASSLSFKIGPKLAAYIAKHGVHMTSKDLDTVQIEHYGQRRKNTDTLLSWIETVSESSAHHRAPVQLPMPTIQQIDLWKTGLDLRSVQV